MAGAHSSARGWLPPTRQDNESAYDLNDLASWPVSVPLRRANPEDCLFLHRGAAKRIGKLRIPRGYSMPQRTAAALEAARSTIERHLLAAFAQLDAGTADVEIRKKLYASMIRQAVQIACERFPDNTALIEMLEKVADCLRPPSVEPSLVRNG